MISMAWQKAVKKNGSTSQKYSLTNTSINIKAIVEMKNIIQCLPRDFASFIWP